MSIKSTTQSIQYERPPLIKAGDTRVGLGMFHQAPKVDLYVIAAENLHALERQHDELLAALESLNYTASNDSPNALKVREAIAKARACGSGA